MVHLSRRPDVLAGPVCNDLECVIVAEVGSDTCHCSNESSGPFEQVHFHVGSFCDASRFPDRENIVQRSGGKLTQPI
jgi:hypothetical protein